MSVVRLKPHLAAHVVSPQEVALLGEGGRFALHGKVYAAVVPLLDGKRSDDVIVARLSGRFSPELVYYALGELEAKGYVLPAARGKATQLVTRGGRDTMWRPRSSDDHRCREPHGSSMQALIGRPWRPCGLRWGADDRLHAQDRTTWW